MALFRTKIVHIGLVVVSCLWRVHLAGGAWRTVKQDLGPDDQKFGGKGSMQFAARVGLLPGLSFWLGGTCEAFFQPDRTLASVCKYIGLVTAQRLGSLIVVWWVGFAA